MVALLFDTCCGCIELRTGCLIIGYLNLVFSIVMGVVLAIAAGVTGSKISSQGTININGREIPVDKALQDSLNQAGNTFAVVLGVILIIFLILFFTFTIVLLVGIHKNKRGHVKAYLIYAAIFLILYVIGFFVKFAQPINAGNIVGDLISIVLCLYFLLVIRSYYYKMNDTNRQPAIYNAP